MRRLGNPLASTERGDLVEFFKKNSSWDRRLRWIRAPELLVAIFLTRESVDRALPGLRS
jgi:hypothetical protein